LEGNGRLESIQSQLQKYHPTRTVYILFNKGFKKCEKDPSIDKSPLDLIDAFFQCFKDASTKNYENILILEDDFFFDERMLDSKHAESIEQFLQEKRGDNFIYYLGCIPNIQLSTGTYHNRVYWGGGMHACIYPRAFYKYLLDNIDPKDLINTDWDIYTNFNAIQYMYHTSLCYQLWPETENKKNWGNNWFEKIIVFIMLYFLKLMKLDTQVQSGYNIMEFTSKFIFWFIVVTQIFMNIFIFLFVKTNYKWLKKNWHYYIYLFLGGNILYPTFIILLYIIIIYLQILYHNL
jgi:hypothetical protein